MSVILILILASLGLAVMFLAAFVWAVRGGQYEDTCTPSMRVLIDAEQKGPVAGGGTDLRTSNLQTPKPGAAYFQTHGANL